MSLSLTVLFFELIKLKEFSVTQNVTPEKVYKCP